jgi:hypothetical protein
LGHTAAANNAQRSSIADSYAPGNVIVHNQWGGNTGIFAGGLVGRMQVPAAYGIDRTFAAGSVSARNNQPGLTRAGGLVGHRQTIGTIRNSAALGPSVTAQGGTDSRRAARIYAFPTTNIGIGQGNFALEAMDIEEEQNYNAFTLDDRPSIPNGFGPDGECASASAFRGQSIWRIMEFHTGAHGWNISDTSRGFPRLEWE